MKKIALLLLALLCLSSFASAEEFTSGDFEYAVQADGTVMIAKYTGNAADLIIPAELDGK